jgi:hypothetical protein
MIPVQFSPKEWGGGAARYEPRRKLEIKRVKAAASALPFTVGYWQKNNYLCAGFDTYI